LNRKQRRKNRKEHRATERLLGKGGEYLRPLPPGCPNPETGLLFPATGIVTDQTGASVAALMFPAVAFPRWSKTIAAHAGEQVRGKVFAWIQERTDGRYGAGILLDVTLGTERIFAGIGLLEVPAVVDLLTKTGVARLYSDLMRPDDEVAATPEAAALGIKSQGWVADEAPYMQILFSPDARRRARLFFEEIYPPHERPRVTPSHEDAAKPDQSQQATAPEPTLGSEEDDEHEGRDDQQ